MPSYSFKNRETGEVVDLFMKISDYEIYVKDHPEMEQLPPTMAPVFVDPIKLGYQKPDIAFRERLKEIKQNFPGSTIQTY